MENQLTDEASRPTSELIEARLGVAAQAWESFVDVISAADIVLVWQFYRDGGWLAKAVKATKTICWASIGDGQFTVTFYFAERLREKVAGVTGISGTFSEEILKASPVGKVFPVSFDVHGAGDLSMLGPILDAKVSLR